MNKKTIKENFSAILAFSILMGTHSPAFAALSARDIMVKNEEARKVEDFTGKAKLNIGSEADHSEKTKDFSIFRKNQKDGIHNSTLTRFHAPAEVRDEGILIVENASGKNDVLLYLPAYKKIRRVESQQQSGSFMGSVFSYSDIATPHVEDYQYKELRTEKCPTKEAAAIMCHVIECTPSNNDVRERTGYSKSIMWVRDDNFMGIAGEYYNLTGEKYKVLEANEVKIIDEKNKKWMAHQLRMNNLKTKEYTVLVFKEVQANKGVSDAVFTQQNLQKVK